MPTVAELERLQALVGRLIPLSRAQRGELIRAEDWNLVVGALVELAQAVLAADHEDVVPPHQHPDQVSVGWLDPQLRTMVQGGPLSDPAQESRLAEVERRLGRLATQIQDLAGGLRDARDRVAEVTTRDLARQSDVTAVRRVVEGLGSARDDVAQLRGTLDSIGRDVRTAVAVGQQLTVNGAPVDVPALLGRVDALDQLRDRLKTPSGDLLDAGALERRLTQLTNTLVTQQQLDDALNTRTATIAPDVLTGLEDRLRTGLRGEITTANDALGTALRTEIGTRLGNVDTQVARAVADAMPSVLGTARGEIATAVERASADTRTAVGKQIADEVGKVRNEMKTQVAAVRAEIAPAVGAAITSQLPAQLDPLRGDLAKVSAGSKALDTRVGDQGKRVDGLATRIEVVARDDTSARTDLESRLRVEMDRRDTQRSADLDTRLAALDQSGRQRLDAAVADARRTIVDEARRAASETAAQEVSLATDRLRGEIRAVAREEIATRPGVGGLAVGPGRLGGP